MAKAIATLPRLTTVFFTLEFQDTGLPTVAPLAGAHVRLQSLDKAGNPVSTLFDGRTNATGQVRVAFRQPAFQPPSALPQMLVTVLDLDGDSQHESTFHFFPDKPIPHFKVSTKTERQKVQAPLGDGSVILGKPFSPTLDTFLKKKKVTTLATLRAVGDLSGSPALTESDRSDLKDLEAHARLQLVSRQAKINQALIQAGYTSVLDIARQSLSRFAARMAGAIGEELARRLHAQSLRTVQVLENIRTDAETRRANGREMRFSLAAGSSEAEPPCACRCDSAVSPQAYLVDLLDYAVDHVLFDGNPVDLSRLEATFCQPFGLLPPDCDFASQFVRQVRLCIQILHRRNVLLGGPSVQNALTAHSARAYEALLAALGTSQQSLRLARADAEAQRLLAERLGIAKKFLDNLRLEATGTGEQGLTEDNLERLFGLQATARQPLSTGAKFNDTQSQLLRWQLRGVQWRHNTDARGRLHLILTRTTAGNTYTIELFKHPNRQAANRVARGSLTLATGVRTGVIELMAVNASGLSGLIAFNHVADTAKIFLAVVPELAVRRREYLRILWQQADNPSGTFEAPLVDPDLVFESDLMQPFDRNPAYKLWDNRKHELQNQQDALTALGTISAMLENMFGSGIDPDVWVDEIAPKLSNPDPAVVEQGLSQVGAIDPHLTSDTFRFLLALWRRETGAGPSITDQERQQAVDVLVNIFKARKFPEWHIEETAQGISLSAPFFFLSLVEPSPNPLRAGSQARQAWRAELERLAAPPVIDPDNVAEKNFRPGPASDSAYRIFTDRQTLLSDLFIQIAAITSPAALDTVLTGVDLPSGSPTPIFHSLGFTSGELAAIDQALQNGQRLPVTLEQYGLTPGEVRALFTVRRLGATADSSDWDQVHHILVQAEKRRYLYPVWRREESDAKIFLNPEVFFQPTDALSALLPVLQLSPAFLFWRFDARRQRAWQEQVQARLDQDQAVAVELQTAVDAAEAASLVQLRDDLVMATVTAAQGGESLPERQRWVMNHLLVNAFENGCRKTTRVAQAIETMQLFLWGIHSGHFEQPGADKFTLESGIAPNFAEAWAWIGSYATWRAAMFTYLYPENLLLPDLRQATNDPDTNPTLLFRAIMKVISGQAPPPSAQEPAGDTAEAPPSIVDEELAPYIDRIYQVLDNHDPMTRAGQELILQNLQEWRLLNGVDAEYLKDAAGQYLPEILSTPPDAGPYYFTSKAVYSELLLDVWCKYITNAAFLEDLLYIPLLFALSQHRQGHFEDALYWYGRVYDFRRSFAEDQQGWTDPNLELYFRQGSDSDVSGYPALDDWLNNALNPHQIAATRLGADLRFVLLSISRCLLDYADSEFSKDSSESLARARELYETARRLLFSDPLGKKLTSCQDIIGTLVSEIGEDEWVPRILPELDIFRPPYIDVDTIKDQARGRLLDQIRDAIKPTDPPTPRAEVRQKIHDIFATHFAPKPPRELEEVRVAGHAAAQTAHSRLLARPEFFQPLQRLRVSPKKSPLFIPGRPNYGDINPPVKPGHWDRAPRFEFCIPRNPLVAMLRLRFEVSWFKLNNCLNLAGQRREVPAYAAPTDTTSGLPVAEITVAPGFSTAARLVPTQYRYRVLIERARQLVTMAQQMEAAYLSFLEKRDIEAYNILKARQDLGLARANVELQDLRVTEANDGMTLADLQIDRAETTYNHFDMLLASPISELEAWAMSLNYVQMAIQFGVAAAKGLAFLAAGVGVEGLTLGATFGTATILSAVASAALDQTVYSGIIGGLSTLSSLIATEASFERRTEEWNFQRDLAKLDQEIARAQQTLTTDRYNITVQEREIAGLTAENASDVVNFLNTKFTNADLYTWMGGIVGGIYRYLLQEAATIAKLAQRQLAFERQETELSMIQDDYWTYTDTSAILAGGQATTDRRGLTGSARLLQDLTRLDQEAFLTDRRKLQLSQTISLALHDPVSFAQFRQTGVLPFTTTLELFDRDFPGHYLRLLKRVRVSVIALVPPTTGIRATLASTGTSRVVRGGDAFTEVTIRREPESISFTSPLNATGLFELQEQPEMLLPFEGLGLAAGWIFSMPRAANVVDYSTIADILVTLDYTALESPVYRLQVIQRLGTRVSLERPFSFRLQFADAWYDLNNPELQVDDRQMRVTFETRRADFPPNLNELRIAQVSLYFNTREGFSAPIEVRNLLFTETGRAGQVGGRAVAADGLISTRNANAGSWEPMKNKQPVGRWELRLPNTDVVKNWFKEGQIKDILFVLTYSGTTPTWP